MFTLVDDRQIHIQIWLNHFEIVWKLNLKNSFFHCKSFRLLRSTLGVAEDDAYVFAEVTSENKGNTVQEGVVVAKGKNTKKVILIKVQ